MPCFDIRFKFHPVGQGLFSTGSLSQGKKASPFFWVYDCGTTSPQTLLSSAIEAFHDEVGRLGAGKPKLDLVTISHFDKDHISGLVSLLGKFSVRMLLLPYMPLWQRLILAFAEGIDTEPTLMEFFINPVAYIAGLRDARVDRIVLVPGSEKEIPAERPKPEGREGLEDNGAWTLEVEARPLAEMDEETKSDFTAFTKTQGPDPILLADGRLLAAGIWEFVPYNDAKPLIRRPVDDAFRKEVTSNRDELLSSDSVPTRKSALDELKKSYDRQFTDAARMRNIISLFLYAGPIWAPALRPSDVWWSLEHRQKPLWREGRTAPPMRLGVLYTGDGYLDNNDRLAPLLSYMGSDRIERLTCLQVMHHGASGNWHDGLARQLKPDTSVFSSDPEQGNKHPDGPVVRDFLPFGPVLVDKDWGLTIHGHVCDR